MHDTNQVAIQRPTVDRACSAIRAGEIELAEALLVDLPDGQKQSGLGLNLLGIIHECRGNIRQARRAYGKAVVADKCLNAPRQNLRRLYELQTFGRTREPLSLGDHEILLRNCLDHSLTNKAPVSTPF